jgi:hypothetical protein
LIERAKEAERVRITEGPTIESATRNLTIIKWTSNNPGGTDEHFGIVYYGTGPEHLSQVAKSPVRLNQNHALTFFRVRVDIAARPFLLKPIRYAYATLSRIFLAVSASVLAAIDHVR